MKKNHRLIAFVAALATLALLAGCTSAAANGGALSQHDMNTQSITLEEAVTIAYIHAGVDESQAYDKSYERDRDHYEIDFDFNGYEYEYDISLTGEILHFYKEKSDDVQLPKPTETAPVETNTITLEEAVAIAYTHAGVQEAQATDKSYERDDGCYEIDFEFGGYDYEYRISFTGEILHSAKEPDRDAPKETQPKETQPKETQPKETQPKETKPKTISLEEAVAIAYAHAGVKESKATDKSYEKDNGRYEIEFEYNGYDYEYHISYEGKVLRSHKEKDDDVKPTQPKETQPKETQPKTISLEEAVAIAYAHAGVKESKATDKSYEKDNGRYEIEFEYNGYDYEYHISYEGKVLRSHKEKDDDHREEPKPTEPKRISAEEALSIALKHAGVSKSETRERDVEWDDGCWEVSFEVGRTEYEYKISAAGKILHHEKEIDD